MSLKDFSQDLKNSEKRIENKSPDTFKTFLI